MKKLLVWIAGIITPAALVTGLTVGVTGCTTAQKERAVSALSQLGNAVDLSYTEYLGLVAAGAVPTNNAAQITQQYARFRALLSAAQHLSVVLTNVPPQIELSNSVTELRLAVKAEKAKKTKAKKTT